MRKRFMGWIFVILIITGAVLALKVPHYYVTPKNTFEPVWGVTFSKPYAESLGLDWRKAYSALLEDLGARKVRIPVYWNDISKDRGIINLDGYKFMVKEAKKNNAFVVLVVGERLPRWPECHAPSWASVLSEEEKEKEILEYLRIVVEAFRDEKAVVAWQVENEPLVRWFGECEKISPLRVLKEIELVGALDERPIIVTDSGELGTWKRTHDLGGDLFGFTTYRITWNRFFGYFRYPLPPAYYHLRARIAGIPWEKTVVVELQAEPWLPHKKTILETTLEEQFKSMNLEQLRANINYARALEVPEVYLWGAEWWYWLKENGDERLWSEVKRLFNPWEQEG